jgi:hypothetical protein
MRKRHKNINVHLVVRLNQNSDKHILVQAISFKFKEVSLKSAVLVKTNSDLAAGSCKAPIFKSLRCASRSCCQIDLGAG